MWTRLADPSSCQFKLPYGLAIVFSKKQAAFLRPVLWLNRLRFASGPVGLRACGHRGCGVQVVENKADRW